MSAPLLSRRDWLKLSAAGVLGSCVSGWFEQLADAAAAHPARTKSCILLWMSGGPSTIDLWDLKPGHVNGGPFKEIATTAPGVKISEHLPKIARFGEHLALVRSLSSKEGDHGRATHLMHTGYLPSNSVAYPTLGSFVSKALGRDDSSLPTFVTIAPYRFFSPAAYSSGFLGPMHSPLLIADNVNFRGIPGQRYDDELKVKDLEPAGKVSAAEVDSRIDLLGDLDRDFATSRPDLPPKSHRSAVTRALRLMKSQARKAFDLEQEKSSVRDAYGRNVFGQGCLLSRRLVEQGVPFVEVTLGGINGGAFGWDTHGNNFDQVKALSAVLDSAWSALMSDLKDRGLLGSTLIVWMGEFGRTPKINAGKGRDHYPNAWATVLAGGGIKGGQAYGKTSKDGTTVEADLATVPDFMATVVKGLGIDPEKQNMMSGRPIRIVDKGGKPIREIVG
jgi:hypothetical protein